MIRFTKEERIALLFLIAALFVGASVLYCKKLYPPKSRVIRLSEKERKILREIIPEKKKINVNKATKNVLIRIKGIGPVMADRIIAYREKYGPFRSAEELKNVKGIGGKTFDKMREAITAE